MSKPSKILVAGIGNIFLGDDAFGSEVTRRLMGEALPTEVCVTDFGIRSYDLVYALMDGYDTTILVDIIAQGQPAGTVYLIEPDLNQLDQADEKLADPHKHESGKSAPDAENLRNFCRKTLSDRLRTCDFGS